MHNSMCMIIRLLANKTLAGKAGKAAEGTDHREIDCKAENRDAEI